LTYGKALVASVFKPAGAGSSFRQPQLVPISVGPGHGITRLLPGVHPAQEGLGVGITPVQKFCCRPGRRVLCNSGAVKDDFLVLGKTRQLGQKLPEEKPPLQLHAPAFGLVGVSADQKRPAGLHPGVASCGVTLTGSVMSLTLLLRTNIILGAEDCKPCSRFQVPSSRFKA
jgi:hypothetical protein